MSKRSSRASAKAVTPTRRTSSIVHANTRCQKPTFILYLRIHSEFRNLLNL